MLTVVDGDASPPVRSYLTLYEVRERRRRALELALNGAEAGPKAVHGTRGAA